MKYSLLLFILMSCARSPVRDYYLMYRGETYALHESDKKSNLDGYLCQVEYVYNNQFYCIEAFQPTCQLTDRKEMGNMLKLTYQCGPDKDLVYRYQGAKK
jgi:hypothetical protein